MKTYKNPTLRIVDLASEGIMTGSGAGKLEVHSDKSVSVEWTEKKEDGGWGESDIWK